mgnify:CR=1 FL=1
MKILVTGAKGQLGFDVVRELNARGAEAVGADVGDFDITNRAETLRFIGRVKPEAVIHCAAYTAVDKAEDEPFLCAAVNFEGTLNVADACERAGAKLLVIGTDYVFGGEGGEPLETSAPKHPLNVYGKTKLMSEFAAAGRCSRCFIVRTSWVFGRNGGNFVKTMLRLGAEKESITVVSDQVGSPTYTADLARLLCDIAETDRYGVYHAANEGFCSWAEFAAEIMKCAGLRARIVPIPSAEYKTKALRPLNSRLSKRSLDDAGFRRLPPWPDALGRFLEEMAQKPG